MLEVIFTYPTPDGSKEVWIESERTTFGRGGDATVRFADEGLSRLHATVYREGDRIWIVDENSSNGTFVNGQRAAPAGTPLRNGDEIKIGNQTLLSVHMRMKQEAPALAAVAASTPVAPPTTVSSGAPSAVNLVAVVLIGLAFMVASVSVVFVGYKVFAGGTEVAEMDEDPIPDITPTRTPKDKDDKPSNTSTSNDNKSTPGNDVIIPDTPDPKPVQTGFAMPAGKTYLDLSDSEKRQYLSDRALRVAQVIGNSSGEAVPADALDKIKGFTEGYARRAKVARKGGKCGFGDNLEATYERASKNAPFIVKAFNAKATDPRIGLYLAMIESEHCVCLQSPTGPLGMFQFTQATG